VLKKFEKYIGPRVTGREFERHRLAYLVPSILFIAAAIVLVVSIFMPVWSLSLEAPQYPDGLKVEVYVNHMEGDVWEIDGLNHYIGMRPLGDAAQLEKTLSIAAIAVVSTLLMAAILIHNRWAGLLSLPAIVYPGIFMLDLFLWLRHFGLNLDPTAAFSSSVDPFVPPLLGSRKIANFVTHGSVEMGFYLAVTCAVLVMVALVLHRRAYSRLAKETNGETTAS
jgi:hypothetical protein